MKIIAAAEDKRQKESKTKNGAQEKTSRRPGGKNIKENHWRS